ncbi:MAG: PA14 domain-containing protein [Candidatus Competibacterales bacterium]
MFLSLGIGFTGTALAQTGRTPELTNTNSLERGLEHLAYSYSGDHQPLPTLQGKSILETRCLGNDFSAEFPGDRTARYMLVQQGYFRADRDGEYTFSTLSDDATQIYIGNQ